MHPANTRTSELLQHEHRCIERVLDALTRFAETAADGAPGADPARLARFVCFLRGYADALHHGKEERVLFAVLRQQPLGDVLAATLAGVCREHETARLLTDDLDRLARAANPWTPAQRVQLADVVRDYVTLLRKHIGDEDAHVLPAAIESLGVAGMQRVDSACERFEAAHACERRVLEDLAVELAAELPIVVCTEPRATLPSVRPRHRRGEPAARLCRRPRSRRLPRRGACRE